MQASEQNYSSRLALTRCWLVNMMGYSQGEERRASDTILCAEIGTKKYSPISLQVSAISKHINHGR